MTLRGLFLSSVLVSPLAAGCIVTKDMGEEADSESDTTTDPGSGGAMTSASDDAASMTSVGGGDAGSMTSGSDGGVSATASASDDGAGTLEMESTGEAATMSAGTDNGESGSATGEGDEFACESSGGTWQPTSCGHYQCGTPPPCAAVIPGCDCGPTMNFVEGTGCVEDPACLQATFVCGDIECTIATEYCEVVQPGIVGIPSYSCNALPAACVADPTCDCLNDEGIGQVGAQCTEHPGGGLQVEIFAP